MEGILKEILMSLWNVILDTLISPVCEKIADVLPELIVMGVVLWVIYKFITRK